jgi:hypothetical protein
MCRVKRIDDFVEQWPGAEFGPGHIVLGDCNLEDEHIDWCLALLDAVLDGKPWPDDAKTLEHLYDDNDPAEMKATREFLRALRAIPADERVQPGDQLCRCSLDIRCRMGL